MTNYSNTMSRTGSVMRVPLIGKNTPRKSHFKCAIVGDSQCGKTSLIRSHTTKLTFPYTVESTRPLPSQYPGKKLIREFTIFFFAIVIIGRISTETSVLIGHR